jgi:DNA-binding transcriptional MocR family regulator
MHDGSTDTGALDRRSLGEQVHDVLLGRILRDELLDGDRLQIDSIAEGLGVSRTPVREALGRLQWAGFLVSAGRARPAVRTGGMQDMGDRVRLLGSVMGMLAGTDRQELPSLTDALPEEEIAAFLVLAERLADRTTNAVGARSVRDALAPLRIAVEPAVLARHGVDLAVDAGVRRALLDELTDHAVTGDATALAQAIRDYADLLADRFVG